MTLTRPLMCRATRIVLSLALPLSLAGVVVATHVQRVQACCGNDAPGSRTICPPGWEDNPLSCWAEPRPGAPGIWWAYVDDERRCFPSSPLDDLYEGALVGAGPIPGEVACS